MKVAQVVLDAGPSFEFTGELEAAALVVAGLLTGDDAVLLATADADALVIFDPGAEAVELSWWPPHAASPAVIAPSATIIAPRATITESRFIYTYSRKSASAGHPDASQRTVSSASASLRRGRGPARLDSSLLRFAPPLRQSRIEPGRDLGVGVVHGERTWVNSVLAFARYGRARLAG
ncbi:hypothetical protein [Nocardia vaccinii]|uniref:hypothetical protein n=1 Tax=Nocardia vaccinii TaxID=1822 RepID=UPI001FE04964|nr:hypothetical protein [Nocardia vaccinii]